MGLGQLRGPSSETGTPLSCPIQIVIIALGGFDVCDGGHWLVVVKEVEGPRPSEGSDTLPLQDLRGSEYKCLLASMMNIKTNARGLPSLVTREGELAGMAARRLGSVVRLISKRRARGRCCYLIVAPRLCDALLNPIHGSPTRILDFLEVVVV